MDEMNPPNPLPPTAKGDKTRPVVMVKFPGRFAGRIVNNRTGEVIKILVQMRKQKDNGPVDIRMVDPDLVEY